jgi:hypothetical protein
MRHACVFSNGININPAQPKLGQSRLAGGRQSLGQAGAHLSPHNKTQQLYVIIID